MAHSDVFARVEGHARLLRAYMDSEGTFPIPPESPPELGSAVEFFLKWMPLWEQDRSPAGKQSKMFLLFRDARNEMYKAKTGSFSWNITPKAASNMIVNCLRASAESRKRPASPKSDKWMAITGFFGAVERLARTRQEEVLREKGSAEI